MNAVTIEAFLDEMEKIKEAGLLLNVGTRIDNVAKGGMALAKSVPGELGGAVANAGKGISAFGTPVQSFKKGWKATTTDFGQMSKLQKGLMATGLVSSGHEALSKDDPFGKGRGRIERVGTAIGDQLGGVLGTPFGVGGSIAAGMVGRKVGGTLGKGVELIRGRKKPAPVLPETP